MDCSSLNSGAIFPFDCWRGSAQRMIYGLDDMSSSTGRGW